MLDHDSATRVQAGAGMRAGLTRRSFLKTTAIAAGAAALGTTAAAPLTALAEEPYAFGQKPAEGEQIFQGVCRGNCFSACPMNVHVRDGKVVKTSMLEFPNSEMNRICLKGLSHPYRIYSPQRLLHPIRRVEGTERGAGEWEQITWEEAIAEIAEKWTAIREEYGPQALATSSVSGNYGTFGSGHPVYGRLFNILNTTSVNPSVDLGNAIGTNKVVGWAGTWVSNEAKDLVNAKNILVWANNITDAQVQEWHFVAEAIEAGANVVVIDPTFTQLAAKANKWVPIRPASDAALALSMAYVIVEEGLQNTEFLKAHTVAPFLVNPETGRFVRLADTGVEVAEGEPNPYMVVDASGELVVVDEAADPDIEATYDLGGISCKTAYTLLLEDIADYPPEEAEKICDVPADTIRELARLCVDGPVTQRIGWGSQAYDNGVHPAFAILTLAALTGEIGKPGSSCGPADINGFGGADSSYTTEEGTRTSLGPSVLNMPEVMTTGKFRGEDYPVKALFVYCGNPINTATDANALVKDYFGNMELIVTVDSIITDTARYSDIVLPVAQWFEYEDAVASGQHNYICLNEKAIDPLGECKTDSEIARLLADAMGLGDKFTETDDEILTRMYNSPTCVEQGLTWADIKEKKIVRWYPAETKIAFEGNTFLTPSGRMEFYDEAPYAFNDVGQTIDVEREHLPHFFEPHEAWPTNPLAEKYPLILNSERPRYRVHSQFAYNKWLRELDPEPTVKINPIDAEARGLADGQTVEVFNDRGNAVAKLVYNEAVRPGVMVYAKSWEQAQHKAGCWSALTSRSYDPVMVNCSFMDVLVDVRAWEGEE